MKTLWECCTIEDFLEYYAKSGKRELRARLRTLESKGYYGKKSNEAKAIRTLLL
jgi:hypothetical protein